VSNKILQGENIMSKKSISIVSIVVVIIVIVITITINSVRADVVSNVYEVVVQHAEALTAVPQVNLETVNPVGNEVEYVSVTRGLV
jgi:hypothetical protein